MNVIIGAILLAEIEYNDYNNMYTHIVLMPIQISSFIQNLKNGARLLGRLRLRGRVIDMDGLIAVFPVETNCHHC